MSTHSGVELRQNEEILFQKERRIKFEKMAVKDIHMMVFSSVNHLNYTDLNSSSVAKTWAVLYHFRNKTLDSALFDDFRSIAMRNSRGKSKSHMLFNKFYLKCVEKGYKRDGKLKLGQ